MSVPYQGQYAGIKFAPYKYQEYPKLIYLANGRPVQVENAREEREVREADGQDVDKVDPLTAAQSEIEQLKRELAQYTTNKGPEAVAVKPKVETQTVQMLPPEVPMNVAGTNQEEKPTATVGKINPLLNKTVGAPGPIGSAPKVDKVVNPGV